MTYNFDGIFGQTNINWEAILATLGGILLVIGIIFLAVLILIIVAACKFYKKAGKEGWEAIIPFYNDWVFVEIAGLNWWWFLLLIATTIVSVVFGNSIAGLKTIAYVAMIFSFFVCNYNIAKKLHRDTGFAILLTIFPVIMFPIVAFSKNYQFDHSVEVSKNGIF